MSKMLISVVDYTPWQMDIWPRPPLGETMSQEINTQPDQWPLSHTPMGQRPGEFQKSLLFALPFGCQKSVSDLQKASFSTLGLLQLGPLQKPKTVNPFGIHHVW